MKKYGILTFHTAINEGSFLQTSAVLNLLTTHLSDCKSEIIDYQYKNREDYYSSVAPLERLVQFRKFQQEGLVLSEKSFVNETNERQGINHINKKYKAVFIGSDEVWKIPFFTWAKSPIQKSSFGFYPPFPNVYFGEGITVPKFAYGCSIGRTEWLGMPNNIKKQVDYYLNKFTIISVRDTRTYDFIKWINPKLIDSIDLISDPAFSIDEHKFAYDDVVREKLKNLGVDFSRPILGIIIYQYSNKDFLLLKNAIKVFKKRGFQIMGINFNSSGLEDINISNNIFTPYEWVSIFGVVSACISDRYHACISCLIKNTPFITYDLNEIDTGISKIEHLLSVFGLDNYYFSKFKNNEKTFLDKCKYLIDARWPIENVNGIKLKLRTEHSNYLNRIKKSMKEH